MSNNVEKWAKCDILPVDIWHLLDLRIEGPTVLGALLNLWANYAHCGPRTYTDEELARVAGFGEAGLWPNPAVYTAVLGHFRTDGEGRLVPLVVEEWVAKRQAARARAARASRVRWDREKN